MQRSAPGEARLPLRARPRVWASGAAAAVVMVVLGGLGLHPMLEGRADARRADRAEHLTRQITDLRTAVNAWQVYLQPHFSDFSSAPAKIDATDLAKGAVLAQTQQDELVALVATLRRDGLAANATELDGANTKYVAAIGKLALLDAGSTRPVIVSTIANESAAFDRMLVAVDHAENRVIAQSDAEIKDAFARLDRSRTIFLGAAATVALLILVGTFVLGQRARRNERDERSRADRQTFEKTLQDALEMAKTESDAYQVMSEALRASVPRLHVEMLVADSSHAHFHTTIDTGADDAGTACTGCSVASPSDCPATRRSHALVFPSSRALNACPYLKDREGPAISAACIPISLTGQTSGVVHATGPEGAAPTENETHYLATTSRLAAERIAMVRSFERSETQARTDPLTGLLNRRSLENRIHDLERDRAPYALAYGDLDHFKLLNDTHGHEAGDQALRLFSRILLDTLRPDDVAARYGGEEFVVVLPNCPSETAISVLERVRERLALALTSGRVPAFTVSFGLAASTDADTFEQVLAISDRALLDAKTSGRNRVVLANRPVAGLETIG